MCRVRRESDEMDRRGRNDGRGKRIEVEKRDMKREKRKRRKRIEMEKK